MKLLSHERIHPDVHGLRLREAAPPSAAGGARQGTSLVVMQRADEELEAWLARSGGDAAAGRLEGARLAEQLVRKLCRVADLGLLLVDVKPDNTLVADGDVWLVDVSPVFSFYMPKELRVALSRGLFKRAEPDVVASRTRGASLYLMLLLFFLYLRYNGGAESGFERTPRFEGFSDGLRNALHRSCFPLDALRRLPEGELRSRLSELAYHYIFAFRRATAQDPAKVHEGVDAAVENLIGLARRLQLCDPGCGDEVRVNGVDFDEPFASCSGEPSPVVAAVGRRRYPGPLPPGPAHFTVKGSKVLRGHQELSVAHASSRSRSPRAMR